MPIHIYTVIYVYVIFRQLGYNSNALHVMKIEPKTTVATVLQRFSNLVYDDKDPKDHCLVFVPSLMKPY